MEVRGEDFVKNLEIEKQKTKLEEEKTKLEKQKEQSVILNSNLNLNDSFLNDQIEDNELDDIKLDDKRKNKQNYIILAFAFILLFLITIIIIRLVSGSDTKGSLDDNTFIQTEVQEEVINTKHNSNVVNDSSSNEIINKALNIDKIESNKQNEQISTVKQNTKTQELQNNIFEINEQEKQKENIVEKIKEVVKKPIKKVVQKKKTNPYKNIVIKENHKVSTKVSSSKIYGYFIQIGAFSKTPNTKLLNKLHNANLDYKLHKMTINGKKYIKLLVGPYQSNSSALNKLSKTRKISGNKKAYIIRFK